MGYTLASGMVSLLPRCRPSVAAVAAWIIPPFVAHSAENIAAAVLDIVFDSLADVRVVFVEVSSVVRFYAAVDSIGVVVARSADYFG